MTILSNINDLEKILRLTLIEQTTGMYNGFDNSLFDVNSFDEQTTIPETFVRNALSLHGEALQKFLFDTFYSSINITDVLILFELRTRRNTSDMSETEANNLMLYASYELYVILYGDNSTNVANTIVTKFRSAYVRQFLQSNGIYIEQVDEPNRINEFINETMWIRNDVSIKISCQFKFQHIENVISDVQYLCIKSI